MVMLGMAGRRAAVSASEAVMMVAAAAIACALLGAAPAHAGGTSARAPGAPGDTLRVWFASAAPALPYATWQSAAHSVQEAIDAADSGDVVLIKADSSRVYGGPQRRCVVDCVEGGARVPVHAVVFPRTGVRVCGESEGPLPIVTGGDSCRSLAWPDGTHDAVVERIRLRRGGILFYGHFDTTAVVRNCVIEECRGMEGPGIRLIDAAAPLIEENLFQANRTDSTRHHRNGGAIALNGTIPPPHAVIRRNVFRDNVAFSTGGAIRVKGASPLIEKNEFDSNVSHADGGAIVVQHGRPKIIGNIFRGNRATGGGGAIAIAKGVGFHSLRILRNTFEKNVAQGGGAISLTHSGTLAAKLEVLENTFASRDAESLGESILVDGAQAPQQKIFINRNHFTASRPPGSFEVMCATTGSGAPIDSLCGNTFVLPDTTRAWNVPCGIEALAGNIVRAGRGDGASTPDAPTQGAHAP